MRARHLRDVLSTYNKSLSLTNLPPSLLVAISFYRLNYIHNNAHTIAHTIRWGYAGKRRLAAKGRRVHRRQGDKLAGKAAVKRLAHVAGGGGRRGPSAGACRPAERNLLRPGARAGRAGVPTAWGPMPASPDGATLRALHLTGSGRLWMARKRLLLLHSGGQVGRRGRRS